MCFVTPCVALERFRHLWWETDPFPARPDNNKLRKQKYRKFWSMLANWERSDWYLVSPGLPVEETTRARQGSQEEKIRVASAGDNARLCRAAG